MLCEKLQWAAVTLLDFRGESDEVEDGGERGGQAAATKRQVFAMAMISARAWSRTPRSWE